MIKITIPGNPIPQARMRLAKFGVFDPNHKDKKIIRSMLEEFRTGEEIEYPEVSFIFYMPIPKSVSKRNLPVYESGFLRHDKKPDVDNLVKLYLDCLDNIILNGDQKVSLGPCLKLYHPHPRTIVFIESSSKIWQADHSYSFLDASISGKSSSFEMDFPSDSLPLLTPTYLQFADN